MITYEKSVYISDDENIRVFESCEKGSHPPHLHEFIELVYIKSGSGTHTVADVEYKVSHGDLLFVSYMQTHSYSADGEQKFVNILLTPEFLSSELMDGESITTLFAHSMFAEFAGVDELTSQCVHFSKNELVEIDTVINIMLEEYSEKKPGYKSTLHGCMRILFTRLLRKLKCGNGIEVNEVLPEILNYINENVQEKLNLSDIAAKSFYNPAYFSRLLKQYCGMSFSTYVKNKRMEKAADILKNTAESVEVVMQKSGYSDRKLFYRHFKEKYGVSPGEYRKKSKNNLRIRINSLMTFYCH